MESVCKLTQPEIQSEILDNVIQVSRNQVVLEVSQTDYVAVISDESTDISSQTQLFIVFKHINKLSDQVVDHF